MANIFVVILSLTNMGCNQNHFDFKLPLSDVFISMLSIFLGQPPKRNVFPMVHNFNISSSVHGLLNRLQKKTPWIISDSEFMPRTEGRKGIGAKLQSLGIEVLLTIQSLIIIMLIV